MPRGPLLFPTGFPGHIKASYFVGKGWMGSLLLALQQCLRLGPSFFLGEFIYRQCLPCHSPWNPDANTVAFCSLQDVKSTLSRWVPCECRRGGSGGWAEQRGPLRSFCLCLFQDLCCEAGNTRGLYLGDSDCVWCCRALFGCEENIKTSSRYLSAGIPQCCQAEIVKLYSVKLSYCPCAVCSDTEYILHPDHL